MKNIRLFICLVLLTSTLLSFGQTQRTRAYLYTRYETGDKPTATDFKDVFETFLSRSQDSLPLTNIVGIDGTLSTDATLSTASNRQVSSTLALKTYIDNQVGMGQILLTATLPVGNSGYRIAVDTLGADSLYVNNGYPSSGKWRLFATGGGGSVSSVFGRTGGVTATSGDYTAGQITNTPSGTIEATNVQTALNELGTEKLQDATDAVDADNIAAGAVGASELASTAVTAGTYGSSTQIPQIVVDADGRLTSVTNVVAAGGGSATLADGDYVDITVSSTGTVMNIDAGAVGTAEIADLSITNAKIAADAVTATQIASDAVGASEIAANAVGASEVTANAIGSSEMDDNAIGSSEIIAESIQASDIDTSAVTTSEILNGTVALVDLANDATIAGNANTASDTTSGAFQKIILDLNDGSIATRNNGVTTQRTNIVGQNVLLTSATSTTGSTFTPDLSAASLFKHTVSSGSALTIANPSNLAAGRFNNNVRTVLKNTSSSSVTVSFGTKYLAQNWSQASSLSLYPLDSVILDWKIEFRDSNLVLTAISDLVRGNATVSTPTLWNTESLVPVKVAMDSLFRGFNKKVRVLSIGDSNTNHQTFNAYINELFAAEYDTMALGLMVPACDVPSGFTQTISATQVTTDPESVCRIKWYFDATSDSIRLEYLPGSVANRNFNKARFFIQKRPNGGQLRFRIGYGTTVVYDQTVNTASASVSDSILTTGVLSIPSNVTAYVRITCPATGAGGTYLHGYFLENTTDVGYEGIRLGMNGYAAETYSDVIPTTTFKRFIQSLDPEIVTMSLGTNDVGFAGGNNNVTYFKTKMELFVDSLRSYLPGVPIWLITPGDTKNEARQTGENAFTIEMVDTALYGIAQRKKTAFMSIRQLLGDSTTIRLNGYYSDFSHYSTVGQRLIGNTMYEAYGWVRPYSVAASQTPSIVRAASGTELAKIQDSGAADRWTFDFSSGRHTVTVQDTGIVRFNTMGHYPIQQIGSGVSYRGLIGMAGSEVVGIGDGKIRIPISAPGSTIWPAAGAALSLGDTTTQNSGGLTIWSTNQGSILNLHRLNSPSTWVLGDDLNSFTLNRSGSGAQFGLHRNAPASSLMVDSDGSVVFGNTASGYHVGIVGAYGTVGLGITALNNNGDNGIYMTGNVTGSMQLLNNDVSATGNVVSTVKNTNNSNSAANAYQDITSGGASGGDPGLRLTVSGAVNVTMGIDNSNSDVFGIQPYASNNTIAHGFFMETGTSGEAGMNITSPAVTWDVRSRSDQLTAVSSLANTTVTTPLKQFAINAAPEGTVTGAPGDFAFANISSAGRWFGKTTGGSNTGWAEFLHTLNGFANGGNSFSTNATLGTNNARPLSFETNGTRRMSIPAGGIQQNTLASKALMLSGTDSLGYTILYNDGWSDVMTQTGTDTLGNVETAFGHFHRVGDIVLFTLRIPIDYNLTAATNTLKISPPYASGFVSSTSDVIATGNSAPRTASASGTTSPDIYVTASTADDKIQIDISPVGNLAYPRNRQMITVSGSYIVQ